MNNKIHLFSVISHEDSKIIDGGSEFSNLICEVLGKLYHGLAIGNGADVCGRVF